MRSKTAIIILLFSISTLAAANPISDFDHRTIDFLRDHRNEKLFSGMESFTQLGDSQCHIALSLLMCAYGDTRLHEAGKLNATAFALTGIQVYSIKRISGRERPDKSDDLSFPSGHSALAFSTATIFAYYYPRLSPFFYLGATAMAFSRVYLEKHYPSDVIMGAIIGTGSAMIVLKLRDQIARIKWRG